MPSKHPKVNFLYSNTSIKSKAKNKNDDSDDLLSQHSTFSHQNRYSERPSETSIISYGVVKRVNELDQKPRLKLDRVSSRTSQCSQTGDTDRLSHAEKLKNSISDFFKPKEPRVQNLEYRAIKPFINLSKYSVFCGFPAEYGDNGCLCSEPCKWKTNWTRKYQPKNLQLYQNLFLMTPKKETLSQIQKDLPRTYNQCTTFRSKYYTQMLKNMLVAYSIYDPEVGYVQGLNMIAAVLLYHIKNQEMSFWALVDMMDDQELRMLYLDEFRVLKQHVKCIDSILQLKVNDLYHHMQWLDISSELFLYGWILSLMCSCIPLQFMHEVVDRFRSHGWRYLYKLIVTYLLFNKQALLLCEDQAEFLSHMSSQHAKEIGNLWQEMIESAHKVKLN